MVGRLHSKRSFHFLSRIIVRRNCSLEAVRLLQEVIVQPAKCDLCGDDTLCCYVEEIDRWMCGWCIETVVGLLEIFD